jgi:4-hydroxybenzoate polyprenyltransferase
MKKTDENKLPFVSRFLIYQKERFPFIAHGLMISAFTFSAVSYSRICRGESGFISWSDLIIGIFATITLFFLVRIFDEFKDQADDAKYRKYLPVPRGLISLKELKIIGLIVAVIQVSTIAIFQTEMLYLYLLVLVYLMLMGVEFFVPEWLKKRHLIYITSHMVIIPLIIPAA